MLTLASSPPNRPLAPRRTSSTSSSINVRIEADEDRLNGDFVSYDAQYRVVTAERTATPQDWVDCDAFTCSFGSSSSSNQFAPHNIQLVGTTYAVSYTHLTLPTKRIV